MASEDAKNVAREVLENIGKDKKIILRKIIKKNGYTQNTADNPKLVTETNSYKEIINPVVDKWVKERDRLTNELSTRDLTKEQYREIIKSLDLLTKNIQLLSGGKTENIGVQSDLSQEEKEALLKLLNK